MTEDLLRVESLTCGYRTEPVLQDVSFSVEEGCIMGIIGPNGSGKTTLFRALGGTVPRMTGRIFYRGKDLFRLSVRDRAREIALIPQFFSAPDGFSVEEIVRMGRYPHKSSFEPLKDEDRNTISHVLEETGLLAKRSSNVNELSGGEQQSVAIAQGLCQETPLLLLDEPVSHLDIGHQVQVLDMIARASRRQGLTVMIILHDLNLAALYCDRLILLDRGNIAASGTVREVLTYGAIEKIYRTTVIVKDSPVTGKPNVFLIPGEYKRK